MIEGRSSVGRLGLFVHVTAGFGDVGFCGYWTLEMFAVQPVRIYAGVPICQIFYHQICGDITEYVSDKYQHNRDIQPSLLFKELNPESESVSSIAVALELDDCIEVHSVHAAKANQLMNWCCWDFTRRRWPSCSRRSRGARIGAGMRCLRRSVGYIDPDVRTPCGRSGKLCWLTSKLIARRPVRHGSGRSG